MSEKEREKVSVCKRDSVRVREIERQKLKGKERKKREIAQERGLKEEAVLKGKVLEE